MSWATMLIIDYDNKRMNERHVYRADLFGDAQWKQAAHEIDETINQNGPESIHSIYLGDHYCHWLLDDGTFLVPDECKCAKCRPELYLHHVAQRKASRDEAMKVLLIEKKNNPDFIKFVSA